MAAEIITQEDLQQFRIQLLHDLKQIFFQSQQLPAQWLKSNEVRKLLKISPGTLQSLRIKGALHYTKIGGIIYYKHDDILKALENNSR